MTDTRKEILAYIKIYIQEHGYPPSVREIGNGIDLKSTSVVHGHLMKLIEAGELETDAGTRSSRALRVPGYIFVPGKYPYDRVCSHCGGEYIQAGNKEYAFCPRCGHKREGIAK